jgi:hypothetical protein
MNTIDVIMAPSMSSWTEICRLYPDEWVMLVDVEDEPSGMLRAGRLLAHDSSIHQLLDNIGWPHPPNATLVHTWDRPVNMPIRIVETFDELGNVIPLERDLFEVEIELAEP